MSILIGAEFEPMTPTEPPVQSCLPDLIALQDGSARRDPSTLRLADWLATGGPSVLPQRPRRTTAAVMPTPQRDYLLELATGSRDVMHVLAAAELWSATKVAAGRWNDMAGVPAGSLTLEYTLPAGGAVRTGHDLNPIAAGDYRNSVLGVKPGMQGLGPADLVAINGQDTKPQLVLPVALRLLSENNLKAFTCTCLVVDIVSAVASVGCQRLKHAFFVPRPWVFDATITPLFKPRYTAYPAGHALVCTALAVVLADIVDARGAATHLEGTVDDIARMRERAGLHTALDTRAGKDAGRGFGAALVEAASRFEVFPAWSSIYEGAKQEWN